MASELVGGDDSKGSLFEGMVLFTASDLSQPPDPSAPPAPPPPPPSHAQPLDEDLFSDLTLQNPQPQSPHPPLSARQVSRKKKRAVLIGYAPDNPLTLLSSPGPCPPPPRNPPNCCRRLALKQIRITQVRHRRTIPEEKQMPRAPIRFLKETRIGTRTFRQTGRRQKMAPLSRSRRNRSW